MLHLRHKENPRDAVPLALLFFDRYNAEDPLFVADVARRLAAMARQGVHAMIVHASDDAVDRAREALTPTAAAREQEAEVIERAVRMTNQSLTRRMIDEGVSAVSIQGNNRGLFHVEATGSLETGRTEWLDRAVSMGGMPVISLLAGTTDGGTVAAEAAPALDKLVDALSRMWAVTVVYFTTNRKSGLFKSDGSRLENVSIDDLGRFEEVPEVAAVANPSAAAAVFVTNSAGIGPDGAISGTRIT